MSVFVPDADGQAKEGPVFENDGFFPPLAVDRYRADTGIGDDQSDERLLAELTAATLEINASLREYKAGMLAAGHGELAEVPAAAIGEGETVNTILYRNAVFYLARAEMIDARRDYDSTGEGHNRADDLQTTVDGWRRRSAESLFRLKGKSPRVVVLI